MKTSIPQATPTDFERIFHPQNIAIIGISADDGGTGFGSGMFLAIKAMGFEGKIFPVNPKGGNLNGSHIYKQVEDIEELVDFAIITVAAKHVPEVLEGCLRKGIEGVEILSSGFSELGTEAGKENSKNRYGRYPGGRAKLLRHLLPEERFDITSGAGFVASNGIGCFSFSKRRQCH